MGKSIITVIILLFLCSPSAAEKINLPKDTQGWTIFTPSADSRIVYISEQGDDATCQAYTPDQVGNEPFNPTNSPVTCKTMEHALSLTRNGYPDWILFKRGGVYPNSSIIMNHEHSGRSATEPFLISAYGASGSLPSLRPARGEYFYQANMRDLQYMVFADLEWYASLYDTESLDWVGLAANGGDGSTTNKDNMAGLEGRIRTYTGGGYHKTGIMWEGNRFKHVTFNLQAETEYAYEDFIFRRNILLDTNSGAGTVSGKLTNTLFEENIFDHNGWYDDNFPSDDSGDRIRDHNIYVDFGENSILQNNIFSRPSSIGMRLPANEGVDNFLISDNLVFDANIGMGIASNHGDIEYRFKNSIITKNVFTHLGVTTPSHQYIAWAMTFDGLDNVQINNNMVINQSNNPDASAILFNAGLASGGTARNAQPYKSKNSTFANNIFRFPNGMGDAAIRFDGVMQLDNISFINNIFDYDSNTYAGSFQAYRDNSMAGGAGLIENNTIWKGNTYYRPDAALTYWWPYNNGTNPQFSTSAWKSQYDTTAKFTAPSYPDATRTIETYMSHLGEPATEAAFLAKIRAQNRYNWDTNYTAPVINAWLRAGYFQPSGSSTHIYGPMPGKH